MVQNDEGCEFRTFLQLANGEKEHIWVTHNETTFHTYDGPHAVWGPEGKNPLRKKGLGPDDLKETHEMMVLGSHYDRFWDIPKLLKQVKCVIDIFEKTYPGCIGIFTFNNAMSHTAFAEDTLVASQMNLGSGSLVPKMRDTVWNGNFQSMIIEQDHFVYDKKMKSYINLHDKPKGIKWVLTEKGLWQEGMVLECTSCKENTNSNIIDCYACHLMANQLDFLLQCSQIQQEIESRGHK
ncbi:23464_t:CDS:2, partial [Cetraspora pellucida]